MAERFLTFKDTCAKVALSKTVIYARMRAGTFPRTIGLGPQKVVFLESEIDAWMQAQVQTAQQGEEWRRWRGKHAVGSRKDRAAS